jgi:cytochrome d ubiquinol oxidase subunit II
MELNTVWFLVIAVLIAGYAVLDGFDLGVGVLSLFARDEGERRVFLNAIGPVWDGNEVWLLTGGGALFAAFPAVYATAFSAFYLALMLLVVALIFRAVSFEFRGKLERPGWRGFWNWSFGLGSLAAALLYGVAVGNVLRGLPLDASGAYRGSFLGLLNPYSLLLGLVSLALFTMQGAAYMCLKAEGTLLERMRVWSLRSWMAFAPLYALATGASLIVAPHLFADLARSPLFWALVVVLLIALVALPLATGSGRFGRAFLASSAAILAMIGLAGLSLYPRLLPSRTDLAFSLTIYNAASSPRTQAAMLIIALIGMPLVIAYTVYVYRVFRGKVVLSDSSY